MSTKERNDTQVAEPVRYQAGSRGFAVLAQRGSPIVNGMVLSHRGLEVRFKDDAGTIHLLHPRNVFPA